ncbi:hypothetical protein LB566_30290, partial [Mesorhizobium sp. CA13]|uniref:hypothetical protein n=1 Tax=Mesorhizobium sp. CA13 TaxID=2876643 RepID=UPI001CC9F200
LMHVVVPKPLTLWGDMHKGPPTGQRAALSGPFNLAARSRQTPASKNRSRKHLLPEIEAS